MIEKQSPSFSTAVAALVAISWSACSFSVDDVAKLPVLTGDLVERYSAETETSGTLVVGLWLGDPSDQVRTDSMLIRMPKIQNDKEICFSATTRDGVYFSKSSLNSETSAPGFYVIGPMRRTGYAKQLRRYSEQDFALRVVLMDDCKKATGGTLIPAATGTGKTTLLVAVNSRRATDLELWLQQDGTRLNGNCLGRPEVRSTAFDKLCSFNFEKAKIMGYWTLSVRRKPRSGPIRIEDYRILF